MILYGKNERIYFLRTGFGGASQRALTNQYKQFKPMRVTSELVYSITSDRIKWNMWAWGFMSINAGQYIVFLGPNSRQGFKDRYPNNTWNDQILTFEGHQLYACYLDQEKPIMYKSFKSFKMRPWIRYFKDQALIFDNENDRTEYTTSMAGILTLGIDYQLVHAGNKVYTIQFLKDVYYG